MKLIKETFDIVTEESAAEGDMAEHGWIDEEGVSMEPDKYDQEEGITAAEKAADYLRDRGVAECSSWPWSFGSWYSTEPEPDYSTGDHETRHFHLEGFSKEEEKEVYCLLFPQEAKRLQPQEAA